MQSLSEAWLSVNEMAEMLQITPGGVYALVRKQRIPATRIGRRVIIPRAALQAWMDAKTREALAQCTPGAVVVAEEATLAS